MYYSPILFSNISDLNLSALHTNNTINIDELNSKENLIFYCLQSMEYLSLLLGVLSKIERPFIVISAMEDTEFPSELSSDLLNGIVNHPFFKLITEYAIKFNRFIFNMIIAIMRYF